MGGREFVASIVWDDDRVQLSCEGELDLASLLRFQEALELCLADLPAAVILDLEPLTFFGSEGIRALLELVQTCRTRLVELTVRIGPVVERVLDAAGIREALSHDMTHVIGDGGPSTFRKTPDFL